MGQKQVLSMLEVLEFVLVIAYMAYKCVLIVNCLIDRYNLSLQ